jgi:hypothetical protein
MIVPGRQNLAGDRWTAFDTTFRMAGIDLTGATLEAHLRQGEDVPGAPLVDLDTVLTANTQGLRVVNVATEGGVRVSYVNMRINETVMEALGTLGGREVGDDLDLAWDLLITPVAAANPGLPAVKQRYLRGVFTVEAGATQ